MELSDLGIPEKRISLLKKKGILNTVDLLHLVPYKYYDFTELSEISFSNEGHFVAIAGRIESVKKTSKNGRTNISLKVKTESGNLLYVTYIGQAFMKDILEEMKDKDIVVCGNLRYTAEYGIWSMLNPVKISRKNRPLEWYTVYPKYKGISEEWLKEKIRESFLEEIPETVPKKMLEKFSLPGRKKALESLHYPVNEHSIRNAIKRNIFEDLLYFSCKLEMNDRKTSKGSQYNLKNKASMAKVISGLPYCLTGDQKKCLNELFLKMTDGRRISALIQGDVGCGKSIVAFLLMLSMADSGYQSVLMAPTVVLAKQHYEELCSYAIPLGYKVAFLGGNMTAKEKRELLKGIESGDYPLIVGTHAVIADAVTYKELALAIVDEEHRFGVAQRDALSKKAAAGVHTVSFSATPIPRTVADAVYGSADIFEIKEMPPGRSPVQTAISKTDTPVYEFCKKELEKNHQIYVVCPLVDENENSSLKSVKQKAKDYEKALGVPVGIVSGKQKKTEQEKTLEDFKSGRIPVLCATTVIEVGVNVPNATVIVIEDAYMFGLAQLHQLRGRVGRGKEKGYCILKSDKDAERLQVLCETTDGFKIAEKDLELRGSGNILGESQSGSNRFIEEALAYPNMFRIAKQEAKEMVDYKEADVLIEEMEKRSEKIYVNPQKTRFFK